MGDSSILLALRLQLAETRQFYNRPLLDVYDDNFRRQYDEETALAAYEAELQDFEQRYIDNMLARSMDERFQRCRMQVAPLGREEAFESVRPDTNFDIEGSVSVAHASDSQYLDKIGDATVLTQIVGNGTEEKKSSDINSSLPKAAITSVSASAQELKELSVDAESRCESSIEETINDPKDASEETQSDIHPAEAVEESVYVRASGFLARFLGATRPPSLGPESPNPPTGEADLREGPTSPLVLLKQLSGRWDCLESSDSLELSASLELSNSLESSASLKSLASPESSASLALAQLS